MAGQLVIAGTSHAKSALPQLDTTPIGGTNYGSTASADYPYGYIIVGVQGAPAGQAYENASTYESNPNDPANFVRANGVLTINPNNMYDFHASDYVEFSVRPTDSRTSLKSASISIGNIKYTPPAGTDGFWLLQLERRNLYSNPPCNPTSPTRYENCGTFYNTNNLSPVTALSAEIELAEALSNAGKSRLIFLVSVGTPIGSFGANALIHPLLKDAIDHLGASGYTLGRVPGVRSPVYTLVSSNDAGFQETFTGSAVVSNNVDKVPTLSSNPPSGYIPQTGFVHGVLGRDNHGLFRPLASSQESQSTIDTASMQDFSAYSLFWTQPISWPLSDAEHLGAYKYLSYSLVKGNLPNATGTHLDDIRFYYPGSQMDAIRTGATQPKLVPCHNPGDTFEFDDPPNSSNATKYQITYADCVAVQQQLTNEFSNLNSLVSFFDGVSTGGGIRNAFFAASSGVLANMFSAVSAVDSSTAISGAAEAQADANAAKWLKLAGSLVSAVPGGGPVASVTGGILNTIASSVTPPTATSADLASAFAQYESTVSTIYNQQNQFMANLSTGFDTVIDNAYSDWGKLNAISAKTGDTNPGGWYVPNNTQLALITQNFADSTKRYFYLQAMAKAYSMDSWSLKGFQFPSQIGGSVPTGAYTPPACETVYENLPQYSWFSYTNPSDTTVKDIFIIGGTVTTHFGLRDEQFPSADLLNTLFGNPLYLQQDLFFALNGPLPRRGGTIPAGKDVCKAR